ncbi:MAG: lysylphosphatidylglycerol synthase transmembrane domain-containing protein [bacterium]
MRFGWRGALGIAISAACLIYVFRGIDWADARARMAHANYGQLALAAVTVTFMFPLRARRWRTILDPIAPKLPFGPLWRSTAIGMMVNNTVPARAGEPARAYALTREVPSISFSAAIASLVVDRVFDAIVVVLLMVVAIVAPGSPAGSSSAVGRAAVLVATVAATMLIALYSLVFFPDALIRVFELVARRVSPLVEKRGAEVLRSFAGGLSILKSPAHFLAVFMWTLAHWLVQPLAFWLGFRAVGIDVPFAAALLVQGIIVVGVSLPSTPGFFGPFETAATWALPLYGVSASAAATWAIVFHVVSFIPITLIGAYYFARLGLTMGEIGTAGSEKTT